MEIGAGELWAAAAVLMGFQVTSLAWRISHEVEVGKTGDLTWLPPADLLNILSIVVALMGVYIFPVLGFIGLNFAKIAFGLALLLFTGFAFALPAHYDMYNRNTPRSYLYFPFQEKVAVAIAIVLSISFVFIAIVVRS